MRLTTVIIENDPGSPGMPGEMIRFHCSDVEIIGEAEDLIKGFPLIEKLKPQLVFLNIELPDREPHLSLLKKIDEGSFYSVLITNYTGYLTESPKFHSFDYLLKPINSDDLIATVAKAKKSIAAQPDPLFSHTGKISKIILRTSDTTYLVEIKDIIRCEAHNNYTIFFLSDGQEIITSQTLKAYENLLNKSGFFRVHQSHLINMSCIKKYSMKKRGVITMLNDHEIPVSQRKKGPFLKWLNRSIIFF